MKKGLPAKTPTASARRSELDLRSSASSSCLTIESMWDWLCLESSFMEINLLAIGYAASKRVPVPNRRCPSTITNPESMGGRREIFHDRWPVCQIRLVRLQPIRPDSVHKTGNIEAQYCMGCLCSS